MKICRYCQQEIVFNPQIALWEAEFTYCEKSVVNKHLPTPITKPGHK